jgi:hypothetical protein
MIYLKAGILISLMGIFYQDLKHRAVYWFLFPGLFFLLFIFSALGGGNVPQIFSNLIYNNTFLFIQLLIVTLYLSLKLKKLIVITQSYLGWGDILFMVAVSGYLSFLNYVVFYIFSLLITLLAGGIAVLKTSDKKYKIPLAGIQALIFAGILLYFWTWNRIDLSSDTWLINYLS